MCGGGYSYFEPEEKKARLPIWKLTGKKKHIVFYGDPDKCYGRTGWCERHCYIKTKPPKISNFHPRYNVNMFRPKELASRPFAADFLGAEYVTFFASGTLTNFDDDDGEERNIEKALTWIPNQYPQKVFRYFIRHTFKLSAGRVLPKNAVIIFSADCETDPNLLDWAIESKLVRIIAIVDHKDNRLVTEYLEKRLPTITCKKCKNKFDCFTQEEKTLLLMNYIGG